MAFNADASTTRRVGCGPSPEFSPRTLPELPLNQATRKLERQTRFLADHAQRVEETTMAEENSIAGRIREGMFRAKKRGVKLGRPKLAVERSEIEKMASRGFSLREIASALHCSKSYVEKQLSTDDLLSCEN